MFEQKTSPAGDTQGAVEYLRVRPGTLGRWRSVRGGWAYIQPGSRVITEAVGLHPVERWRHG